MSKRQTAKRNIFSELMEGVDAMKEHREGKVTLRTHKLPAAAIEESPGAEFFIAVRKEFNVSRSVWATCCELALAPGKMGTGWPSKSASRNFCGVGLAVPGYY